MTATTHKRSLFAVFIGEPIELAKAQPHQVLLSTGSVAIMAQFAAHSGIVDPLVGYCIAGGVEWAYLRGLASDAKATTWWGDALNWSAFGIVVLWGILWVATIYGAIPARLEGLAAFLVAAAHVVPIAWLSLCSAMCHRASLLVEHRKALAIEDADQARRIRIQQEHDLIELDAARKRAELLLWEEGQAAKMRAQNARTKMRTNARPARGNADEKKCPKCGMELEGAKWLAACRWGHCASCKET